MKELTCVFEFHMASGRHFEMEMSSDGLKIFGLLFYDGLGGVSDSNRLSNGFDGCKKQLCLKET